MNLNVFPDETSWLTSRRLPWRTMTYPTPGTVRYSTPPVTVSNSPLRVPVEVLAGVEAPQPAKSAPAPIPATTLMAMIRGLLVFRLTVMMIHGGQSRFAFHHCGQGVPPTRRPGDWGTTPT